MTLQALYLNDKLYESVYEAQLFLLFDHGNKYIGTSDAWPEAFKKLKKGSYTARLHVRHDDVTLLEKLKTLPISIDKTLPKVILNLIQTSTLTLTLNSRRLTSPSTHPTTAPSLPPKLSAQSSQKAV